ncbi:MAG: NlpC/P60 family protein [Desulfomonile sp.]|nr:NlpC/P60 family protein [Desulfomonile sp.]
MSLACSGWLSRAEALGREYARLFELELATLIHVQPRYVWGGIDETTGVDCSGYVFLAARRAGMPVRRTTSARMAEGEAGWDGAARERGHHRHLDLVFWTLKPHRPNGHTGVVWRGPDRVTHASRSKGRVVVAPLVGELDRGLTKIIRLTIGD